MVEAFTEDLFTLSGVGWCISEGICLSHMDLNFIFNNIGIQIIFFGLAQVFN